MAGAPKELAPLTYTVPQAAQVLNVSDDMVRALLERGDIPSLWIGRRVLISRAALDQWVRDNANRRFDGIEQAS